MSYLLDSDVLIQAKNLHYGLDFCPAFWDWLITKNSNGLVYSRRRLAMRSRQVRMSLRSGPPPGATVSSSNPTQPSFRLWPR